MGKDDDDAQVLGEDPAKRDTFGRFVKGSVANPSGRPKADRMVREMLQPHTKEACERLVEALSATMWVGGAPGVPLTQVEDFGMRLRAAQVLLDRVCGKPVQAIASEDGGPVEIKIGEDLIESIQRLAAK